MQPIPVQSSMLTSIALDGDTLTVTFTSGVVGKHSGVTNDVFAAFASAPSAGRYYNENIRGKYPYTREVEKEEEPTTQSER